jgi:hypothetical protein
LPQEGDVRSGSPSLGWWRVIAYSSGFFDGSFLRDRQKGDGQVATQWQPSVPNILTSGRLVFKLAWVTN